MERLRRNNKGIGKPELRSRCGLGGPGYKQLSPGGSPGASVLARIALTHASGESFVVRSYEKVTIKTAQTTHAFQRRLVWGGNMPLGQKDAARLIEGLNASNKDYFVKTFSLSEEEAEFLLGAWKVYAKGHPQVLKSSPLRFLDSFIHGYLAHVELVRAKQAMSYVAGTRSPEKRQD